MFRKIVRELGFVLISNSVMFTPILAAADDGSSGTYAVIGFPVGALVTGLLLVSMSNTKVKATKAEKYVKGKLVLHDKSDVYVKTETDSHKIDD